MDPQRQNIQGKKPEIRVGLSHFKNDSKDLSLKKNISLPMKWLMINDFITLLTNSREQCPFTSKSRTP